jgi:hypothetical protein
MSYAGLGQLLRTGTAPITGLSVNRPASGTPTALINVGIPPELVKLFGVWLWNLGMSMGLSDPNRGYFILVGGTLKAPRLNTFGLVDPASVVKTLSQLPANLRAYADNGAGPKIAGFLADIAAGKYAGQPPAISMRSPLLAAAAPRLATATLNAQRAAIVKTAADIQKAAATKAAVDAKTAQDAQIAAAQVATASQAAAEATAAQQAADAAVAQIQSQIAQQAPPVISDQYGPPQIAPQIAPPGSAPGDGYVPTTTDNSQPQPQPDSYSQPVTPALPAPPASPGPFGVSWKIWAVGAAVAAGGYLVMNSKMMSANRRRRVRRNRRSRRTR